MPNLITSSVQPTSPGMGDEWHNTLNDRRYVWMGAWVQRAVRPVTAAAPPTRAVPPPPQPTVSDAPTITNTTPRHTMSDVPPTVPPPVPGDFWFDTTRGFLFSWYDDGNTIQWVVANPGNGRDEGPPGQTGDTGPPGITWRGVWDNTVPYKMLDGVEHLGSSYHALLDSIGNAPDATPAVWSLLAAKGDQGEPGGAVTITEGTGIDVTGNPDYIVAIDTVYLDSVIDAAIDAIPDPPPATVVSLTPPVAPLPGQMWFCSDSSEGGGQTYLWFDDGTSQQWVPVTPIPSSGGGGSGGGGIAEAPIDGQQYGRKDANWSVITGSGSGGGITQADADLRYVNVASDTMTGTLTIGVDTGTLATDHFVWLTPDGWLSIQGTWPGWDLGNITNAVDERRWQVDVPTAAGGALSFKAVTDAWATQKEWFFNRDGSTTLPGALTGTTATFSDKVNVANSYQIDGATVLFETPGTFTAIAAMDGHIGLHVGPVDNFYRATTHHIQNMDGSGEPVLISPTTMTVNVPLAGTTANFTGPLSISGKKAIEFSDPEYVSFGSVRAGMTVGEVGNNYYNASNHFLRSSDTTTTFATINASGTALTGPLTGTTATFTGVTLSGAGSISPAVNNIGTLGGSASLRWSNVYSVMGDFSGLLTGANAVFSSTVTATGFNIGSIAVGYLNVPQNLQASTYQTVLADAGKHIYHAVGAAAATWTIPANGTVAYSVGTTLTFVNDSANAITIAITTDTLVWSPGTTTGSRTLGVGGIATALKVTPTRWLLSGTGIT